MATFEGTTGNDTLEGTEGSDVITGDAGNDSLSGLGGDDIIFGGAGNDTMRGGEGNDTFVSDGIVQTEVFDGGPGTDTIELRFGSFQVTGVSGPFAPHTLNSSQILSVERLVFASEAGQIVSGQILATQVASSGLSEVVGGAGTDNLTIILPPGSAKPTLTFTGFDAAPLNPWDNVLADRITLVTVAPTTLTAYAGLNIAQNLVGSTGNDTLIGSDNGDILNGGAGVNVLQGGTGNDMLVLVNAAVPNGSGGFNPPSFLTGQGSLFDGGDGFDLLGVGGYVFFQGTLQNMEGFNLLPGFTPPVPNTALQEPAYLDINASAFAGMTAPYFRGIGTVSIDPSDPATFEARSFDGSNIVVEAGSDIVIEIDGGDNDGDGITITGSNYDDEIFMGDGAQVGNGGDGDDILNIGGGNQTITGEAGADRFQIDDIANGETGVSDAVITDFTLGEDKIDLDETGIINLRRAFDFITQGPNGAVIGVDGEFYSFSVTLQGVDLADLSASDFLIDQSADTQFPKFETDSGFADLMLGGAFNDSLIGGEGNDTIYTGGGRDTIDAGNGDDRIIADGAVPAFSGNSTPVQFNGGAGFDVLELRSFEGSVTSLFGNQLSTYAFLSNINGIEEFEFASLAGEWVSTNLVARTFVTTPGGPVLVNLPLPAHLRGGEGMDSLALIASGGMGSEAEILVPTFAFHDWDAVTKAYLPTDSLIYVGADGASPTSYVIRANSLNAQQDVLQHLIGGGGNDTLIGSEGSELLNGNGGSNLLQGLGGDDALFIGNGTSASGVTSANTGAGSVFDGGEGNDFLSVGGAVNFQGTLQDIEGIYLQPGYTLNNGAFGSQARAQLTISFAEISKLGPNARFDGVGDIFVTMDLNDNLDTSGFIFEAGSDVTIDLGGGAFTGTSGNDSLTGTGGPDTFFLLGGRDTVVAGAGNDAVVLNGPVFGGSNLDGGSGFDTLVVENTNLSTVASSQFPGGIVTASNGIIGATVAGFEQVVFASGAGTASNFLTLLPQLGSAFPTGLELVGGDGYDTLTVISLFNTGNSPSGYVLNAPEFSYANWQAVERAYQPGDRVLVLNNGNANGVMNGSAHQGVQILIGGAGNETINGSDDMDFLSGGLGVNQLFGGGGDDTLFFGNSIIVTNNNGVVTTAPESTGDATGSHFDGGAGTDFLMIGGNVNFKGTVANLEGIYLAPAFTNPDPPTSPTQITTTQRQNYTTLTIDNSLFQLFPRDLEIDGVGTIHVEIDPGTRFDGSRIVFTDGSDVRFLLEGSAGNDIIIGTAGEDTFEGDSGTDFFTGGAGNDVFQLSLGVKIVTDFTIGEDRFDVSELGLATLAEAQALFSQSGSDARFSVVYNGQTNAVVLKNVQLGDLAASDFIFASPTAPRISDATELADLIVGQAGNDLLSGLGGNDTIRSGGGSDTIDGGEGNDTVVLNGLVAAGSQIDGGIGTDTLAVTAAAGFPIPSGARFAALTGATVTGFEALRFEAPEGTTLIAALTPGQAASITSVTGSAANDTLLISAPTTGGTFALHTIAQNNWTAGSDIIVFGNSQAAGALDLSTANHVGVYAMLGGSADDTITGSDGTEGLLGNGGDDSLSGGGGNDTLDGGAGNDTLDGGAGVDSMIGGAGDDLFILDNGNDTVSEASGGGNDTVSSDTLATIDASSFGEIETIRYTGTANARLIGTDGNNTIIGSSGLDRLTGGQGDDLLDGGTGADTMLGGLGNDTFVIDDAGDRGVEVDGEGIDTYVTSLSAFSLLGFRAIENLTSTFAGGALLTGNASDNAITGAEGNDTLDGGVGADTLDGGLGDDIYIVDSTLDVIIDSGGIDTVRSRASWTLADGLERLELLAAGTGTGNDADNTLTGSAGADTLLGGGGSDLLIGGAAGDRLDGGTGADTMRGGTGGDTYIVDDAGDVVDETGGDGTDTVLVSLNDYTLTAGVERLSFTGTGSFSGIGNELANLITGGAANDTLQGGEGNDTLDGGLGDDTYFVESSADVLRDSGGIDRVFSTALTYTLNSTVEHLHYAGLGDFTGTGNGLGNEIGGSLGNDLLSGLAGADTLSGSEGNDTLLGGAGIDSLFGGNGSDILVGGIGRDVLSGGTGADVFRFDTLTDTRTGANADLISDFEVGQDRIDVSGIDPNATLAGDQSYGFIGTAAFSALAGQAEVRFVNSGGNTLVHFDNDGNGTIDMSLVLTGTHTLTAAEFIL